MKKYFEKLGSNLSLKERAYKNIKEQIIRGNIKPGKRLLEEEIAKAMNISRAPIREAFNRLEKDGFVQIIARKGTIVSKISNKEVEDIFEIRETLEVLAIKKSMGKISIKQIEKVGNEFEKFINKPITSENKIKYLELDREFHNLLNRNCNNNKLINILDDFQELIHWMRNYSLEKTSFEGSIEEHLNIIEALKKKDERLAIATLQQHLKRAKESSISEVNSWESFLK